MATIDTIVMKLKTDADFYKSVTANFEKALAPYNLSAADKVALKETLLSINPPVRPDINSKKR